MQGWPDHALDAVEKTAGRLHELTEDADAIVCVCHSEPGAWSLRQSKYEAGTPCPTASRCDVTVGRTMFETDRLPEGWEARLNQMDDVWVPTEFHRGVFERAWKRGRAQKSYDSCHLRAY